MYRWLRNLHLFLGLFSSAYLLMYAWSGIQMSHNQWFSLRPASVETSLSLPPRLEGARAVARHLMEHHGAKGEIAQVAGGDAHLSFRLNHPGTAYEVRYEAVTGDTRLITRSSNRLALLNRIHHVAGMWHEYWLLNVFGIYAGIVSIFLLPMAATGIYLWFNLHQERLIGAILLGFNLLVLVPLLVWMRAAP